MSTARFCRQLQGQTIDEEEEEEEEGEEVLQASDSQQCVGKLCVKYITGPRQTGSDLGCGKDLHRPHAHVQTSKAC